MTVTVFTKPGCPMCVNTKRALDVKKVKYQTRDITEDEAALAQLKELGHLQLPVVHIEGGEHWSGHRPDMIVKNF